MTACLPECVPATDAEIAEWNTRCSSEENWKRQIIARIATLKAEVPCLPTCGVPHSDHSEQPLNMVPVEKAGETGDKWIEELIAERAALRAEVERLEVLAERPHWTPEQIDSINAEMADGIIHECIELLSKLPCHHGQSNVVTPPMMLREAILCSVGFEQAAREKAEARVRELEDVIVQSECPESNELSCSRYCYEWASVIHDEARAILARQKEESK